MKFDKMFSNVKLRDRIILGYSVPLVFSITIAAVVYSNVVKVEQQNKREVLGYELVRNTDMLALSLAKSQRAARGYLLKADPNNVSAFQEAETLFNDSAQYLQEKVEIAEQKQLLNQIVPLGKHLLEFNNNLMNLVSTGRLKEAIQSYNSSTRKNLNLEIEKLVQKFVEN
ncbi:MAG: CHASE3 domain-containing protein, partial [Phormidium sp.]